jgi:hypothetical protein
MDCVLVKNTVIVLFDEHLVKRSYKRGKEPRGELKALFKTQELLPFMPHLKPMRP